MKHHLIVAVLTLAACAAASLAAELGYYSKPALHGDRLVFVSEGDLWTATIPPVDEGNPIIAHRLTASDGIEADPRISPDGQWIAFSGQYDGNTDVYVMPIDGGAPRRLTYHGGADETLAWTPDGRSVLFRSRRASPLGRDELWRISPAGGMPQRYAFGECAQISLSSTGSRFAFVRRSNERSTWKRYRGGTAPEIWVGDFKAETFTRLTDDPGTDLFPMWLAGRVCFLSDRTGTCNIFSDRTTGGDLKQHTFFAADAANPTAIEGYDIRWPSGDSERRGTRIVFCQGADLALLDLADDSVRRLDVRLASDRIAARRRFADPTTTFSDFALSPDGKTLLLGTRGELLSADVESGEIRQMTRTSNARERGATYLGEDDIALITDATGEQQIAVMPADGSEQPSLATEDRDVWLFAPATAPDGMWIAFADKTMRLHALDLQMLVPRQVDQAEAGEITDYRFSPDGAWLAYAKPLPNGLSSIHVYSLATHQAFPVSDGLTNDREPRWDPAGKYLYYLSDRHLDPTLGVFDLDHVYVKSTQVYALPLATDTPPPLPAAARAAGFDLEAWAKPNAAEPTETLTEAEAEMVAEIAGEEEPARFIMRVDTDGLAGREHLLPIAPGNYAHLEALPGAVCYVAQPVKGILADDWGQWGVKPGAGVLHRYKLAEEESDVIAEKIGDYTISRDRTTIAYPGAAGILVKSLDAAGEPKGIAFAAAQVRVDARDEWAQIFDEAWRLQRDFYWAPNFVGVDWPAMKVKYAALLPRVGSRGELNDLIGQCIAELGTSHTYVMGGQRHRREQAERISVGLLGADIEFDGSVFRITRIYTAPAWSGAPSSPLAAAHLGVEEGSVLLAVNGQRLLVGMSVYELLQDQAGKQVTLTVADDAFGVNRREIEIEAMAGEGELRYLAWVEANRRSVDEATDGTVGYIHIPDMMGRGLSMFSRQFFPQHRKPALVIDERDNGGGFVSQMIIERLARPVMGFSQPRQGKVERYPYRAPHAHMACLMDAFSGSDGDIFPVNFRLAGLGPLIGVRTWGGVVGIRGDKPFLDHGLSTQPEFATWWPGLGWRVENHGVEPDIELDITPKDRIAGRDPQLDRAVEYLLQQLADNPMTPPATPPYPVRTGN